MSTCKFSLLSASTHIRDPFLYNKGNNSVIVPTWIRQGLIFAKNDGNVDMGPYGSYKGIILAKIVKVPTRGQWGVYKGVILAKRWWKCPHTVGAIWILCGPYLKLVFTLDRPILSTFKKYVIIIYNASMTHSKTASAMTSNMNNVTPSEWNSYFWQIYKLFFSKDTLECTQTSKQFI